MPTLQELEDNPEAPRITNIMSGPRYPIGQVLSWMGCLVWNFDILLNRTHDIAKREVREDIAEQAQDSHVTTSGPACGTYTRARQIRRPDLPGGGPPELRSLAYPLGLPVILAKHKADKDRVAVEQANVITTWLFELLTKFARKKKGILAENPRNSLMWETPEAKELQTVEQVEFTNYDACAYAGTRHKKQSLLHNIPQCRTLHAVCHHTHSPEEWKPIRGKQGTKFPTAEEAEYTAAFAWSAGMCIMKYLHDIGAVTTQMTRYPSVKCETGDRVAWVELPPDTMRKGALRGIGTRIGVDTDSPVRLRSTKDATFMKHKKALEPNELYIGGGNLTLRLPASTWALGPTVDANSTELQVLEFAKRCLCKEGLPAIREALRGVDTVICDCKPGKPCHGEVFVDAACNDWTQATDQYFRDAPGGANTHQMQRARPSTKQRGRS